MSASIIRFFISLFLLSFVLVSINYFLLQEVFNTTFTSFYYGVYIYFITLVSIVHFIMLDSLKKRAQRYIVVFMASMGIKIFLSLAVLVVIMYSGINNTKVFAINYLMLYLFYSAFSISQMLRAQKNLSSKE